ncbi:hypothetical protein TRM7557_03548 [Tritonibacter multivorans]|uniref:DUF1330 domain-containing protein n=1 Tax=Tritonibacter multivorans TaxID=928856 RepID=A0A0P1GIT2_9RHOB|nr:hypothetical protein [Tritonibacter multivorans]MDA7420397.1 hypothetical protein [Tritonibacter multivorans]CUH81679.1 hypothetical protein TRM7557_03548 [Tritonibacter multivorans]SFC41091.1 hypothetical protein SAMN04488049_102385 [Tritonibacter multivorans]
MSFVLVDILPLKPGATLEEAVAYFDGLKPVFERHGLQRLDQPLRAEKALRGAVPANLVNLFQTADPESSLKGMSEDPEYQSQMARRDQLFDLEQATILLTARMS